MRPSLNERIDQLVIEIQRRRPIYIAGGDGYLRREGTEVLHVKSPDGRLDFCAKDLQYKILNKEGQCVAPDGVTEWLQIVPMGDADA